jgi:hypothetical protein
MANIWADSFSEIRELSLQEKKGDGNLANNYPPYDKVTRGDIIAGATGKDQMGGKFKKKKVKEEIEEVEQIDEISKELAGRVVNARIAKTGAAFDREMKDRTPENMRDTMGAADKEARAKKLAAGVRARRNATNEELKPLPKEKMERQSMKAYKKERIAIDRLDDPEANKQMQRRIAMQSPASRRNVLQNKKAELNKEERELSSKNNKNDKLDVRKDIHNKINTKPTVSEELEAWVEELIAEGYNLSEFTWDEVSEIYESVDLNEANTYGMPANGDSQKVDPMAAAKAKSAKAKVAKERADLQVAQQSQRLKVSATESVLEYVLGRNRLFEGVFDPKKSRLKPASERTKNAMTDAQRKADKKENERIANIHSKGATVLAGLTSSGKRGKVQTTPTPKPAAPEANRTVKGREDKLASAADKVLKSLKNK